jgi:hypothetical protein
MPTRWVPNSEGETQLLASLAAGADDFGEFVRQRVREVESGLEKYHRADQKTRYVDTIQQATYLNGALVGGSAVRGVGNVGRTPIRTVVYTSSFLGHMLEITGAAPHDIGMVLSGAAGEAGTLINVSHPGFTRRPHFIPGLLSAVSQVGAKMRGRALVGRSEAARLAGRSA